MMAVLPLWCASTLVAYLLGHALLGPKRGFASLLMLGGFASGALLALAGHPLPGIVIGAVSGGVCGALLVRWTGTLRWGPATEQVTADDASPDLQLTQASSGPTPRSRADASESPEPPTKIDGPELEPDADSLVTGPLKPIGSQRPKETPAAKASAARSGSHSALKAGKKSKRKKSKKKKNESTKPAAATLEEESEVAIGTMLEESAVASVDQTAALGTVSRGERTMAGFDARAVSKASAKQKALDKRERLASIPRGVFAMDDETPIALTHQKADAEPEAISSFDEPTENLDAEIAPTHCPRCQAACSPEARYCAGCSAPVMPWGCKECGHQNHAEADFCVRCQAPVELLASPVDVEILDE